MFYKKIVLKNLAIFTETHICVGVSFSTKKKLSKTDFIKKRLQHKCFPVNIAKFLRTPIEEHLQMAASQNERIIYDTVCFSINCTMLLIILREISILTFCVFIVLTEIHEALQQIVGCDIR